MGVGREPLRHFSFIMTNPRGKIEFSGAGGRRAEVASAVAAVAEKRSWLLAVQEKGLSQVV